MRSRGFTLIEVLVSMVILSLLASGFFSAMVSNRQLVARSKMRLITADIARQEIESNRRYIRADTWNTGNLSATGAWRPCLGAYPAGYTCSYKVDPVPGAQYRKVTVEVKWNGPTV